MSGAEMVASVLRAAGMSGVCTVPPSARDCPEPVFCGKATWERVARDASGTREEGTLDVVVCREDVHSGHDVARACERALRTADWADTIPATLERVCGLDAGTPEFVGYDRSGRALWAVGVTITVESDL